VKKHEIQHTKSLNIDAGSSKRKRRKSVSETHSHTTVITHFTVIGMTLSKHITSLLARCLDIHLTAIRTNLSNKYSSLLSCCTIFSIDNLKDTADYTNSLISFIIFTSRKEMQLIQGFL